MHATSAALQRRTVAALALIVMVVLGAVAPALAATPPPPVTVTLRGTLTDGSGGTPAPLANKSFSVEFIDAITTDFGMGTGGLTDATGAYTVTASLRPGAYLIRYSLYENGYDPVWYDGEPSRATADVLNVSGPLTATINLGFRRSAAGTLNIQVVKGDAKTEGLPNAQVVLFNKRTGASQSYVTDSTGRLVLTRVAPDTYKLYGAPSYMYFGGTPQPYLATYFNGKSSLGAADDIIVASGTTVTSTIELPRARKLTVQLTRNGAALTTGAGSLQLVSVSGSLLYAPSSFDPATGVAVFDGLEPRLYTLVQYSSGQFPTQYFQGAFTPLGASQIDLRESDKALSWELTPAAAPQVGGGELKVQVSRADTGAPVWATATLYDAVTNAQLTTSYADMSGLVRFSGLVTGTYKVRINDSGFVTAFYNGAEDLATATPVTVNGAAGSAPVEIAQQLAPAGMLQVRVTLGERPVVGQQITLLRHPDDEWGVMSRSTDAEGVATFSDLAPGSYYVLSAARDNLRSAISEEPVEVKVGQRSTASLELELGAMITGRVTNQSGEGVRYMYVSLLDAADDTFVAGAQTDGDGVYTIEGVRPGSYKVRYGSSSYTYSDSAATAAAAKVISLKAGELFVEDETIQQSNGGIYGRVTGPGGVAVPFAEVYIFDTRGLRVSSHATDQAGRYQTSLRPGSYKVQVVPPLGTAMAAQWHSGKASSAAADPITVGASGVAVDFTLQTAPGVLKGVATAADTGLGLDDVDVYVYRADTGDLVAEAVTTVSGAYQVAGLPEGAYKVEMDPPLAYVNQFFNGKLTLREADAVNVTAAAPATASMTLDRAGIEGTVVDAAGEPVEGARVRFIPAGSMSDSSSESVWTKDDGSFESPGLQPGPYFVMVTGDDEMVTTWAPSTTRKADARAVLVGRSGFAAVTVRMVAGAALAGVVKAEGVPAEALAGVEVRVYREDGSSLAFMDSDQLDEQGAYSLAGLEPGTYKLWINTPFTGPASAYPDQWYDRAANVNLARPIVVQAGQEVKVDLAVSATPTEVLYYVHLPLMRR